MKVLFLCYANSVRSQLAEAVARARIPDWEFASAGVRATAVHPAVLELVEVLGGDPTVHYSKAVYEVNLNEIDIVVRLCAEPVVENLPAHVKELVWELPDPGRAGVFASSEAEFMTLLRRRIELLLPDLIGNSDKS